MSQPPTDQGPGAEGPAAGRSSGDTRKAIHGIMTEVNPPGLKDKTDAEVRELDARFHSEVARLFAGNETTSAESLSREDVVNGEIFLQDEFKRRGIEHATSDELTSEAAKLRAKSDGEQKRSMPSGDPEAGIHLHMLERENERTKLDGPHIHLFRLPGGALVLTNEDGAHTHPLRGSDANRVEGATGEHTHLIVLPDGTELTTGSAGSGHPHELQVSSTTLDGLHIHSLELPDGETIEALSPGEFWRDVAGEPDQADNPDGPPATEVAKQMPTDGLVISPEMALAVIEGRKTLIVNTKRLDLDGQRFLVIAGREAIGAIELGRTQILTLEALGQREEEHLITKEARVALCEADKGWADPPFYGWSVLVVERFEEPDEIDVETVDGEIARGVRLKSMGAESGEDEPSHDRHQKAAGLPTDALVIEPRGLAESLVRGSRKMHVEANRLALEGRRVLVVSEKEAIGVVEFGPVEILGAEQFEKREPDHMLNRDAVEMLAAKDAGWSSPPFFAWSIQSAVALPEAKASTVGDAVGLVENVRLLEREKADDAGVAPSGEELGEEITLEQVLGHLRSFKVRRPVAYIVGGLANNGRTKNDIDILVKGPMSAELRQVIQFRIGRMLPPALSRRIHFLEDDLGGPFSSHVEIGDLSLDIRPAFELKQMRADVSKQQNPFLQYPKKKGPRRAVLQFHFIGTGYHGDLRLQVDDFLVGWTLAVQKPGTIPERVDTVGAARQVARGYGVEGSRVQKPLLAPAKVRAFPKLVQPTAWLDKDGEVFGEGEVGGRTNEKGVIVSVDEPGVEFGVQDPSFHEYFLTKGKELTGILFVRQLTGRPGATAEDVEAGRAAKPGEAFWTAWLSKETLPSVLNRRAVRNKTMPPDGISAIPKTLEDVTPPEFRYWTKKGAEARRMRDALVDARFFTDTNVKLVNGEFRRVEQKLFLTTKAETPAPRRTTTELIDRMLPARARYIQPYAEDGDPVETIAKFDDPDTLFVLDPTGDDVTADHLVDVAKYLKADYLVVHPDSIHARDVLSELGRPFLIRGDESQVYVASFPLRGEHVEWVGPPSAIEKQGSRTTEFVLSWQVWRFRAGTREGPTKQVWHLAFDQPGNGLQTWVLQSSPIDAESITAVETPRDGKALLSLEGDVAPGESLDGDVLNDTKQTPSSMSILDAGRATVEEIAPGQIRVQFRGEKLNGPYVLTAEEKGGDLWVMTEGAEAGRPAPEHANGVARASAAKQERLNPRIVFAVVTGREAATDAPDSWSYSVAVGPVDDVGLWAETVELGEKLFAPLGATANSGLDLETGDVVAIETAGLLFSEKPKRGVRWSGPATIMEQVDGQAPSSIADLIRMLRPGERMRAEKRRTFDGLIDLAEIPPWERDDSTSVSVPSAPVAFLPTTCRVSKAEGEEEEFFVLGEVLVPEEVDTQKDIYNEVEVRKACHVYMEEFGNLGDMHKRLMNEGMRILEIYLAPVSFRMGKRKIKKGTWLMGIRVLDKAHWLMIKSGKRTGFSIGGSAVAAPASEEDRRRARANA